MADPNPLDTFLLPETDESVVNALVASLESRLASPTNKEHSTAITSSSTSNNHVSANDSQIACTNASFTHIKNVQLPNENATRSNNVGSAKTAEKDNQILGINSIHSNASPGTVNSPINSNRTVSPKPNEGVNKQLHAVRLVPQTFAKSPLASSPVLYHNSTPSSSIPQTNSVHNPAVNTTVKKEMHSTNAVITPQRDFVKVDNIKSEGSSPMPHFVKQEVMNSHVKPENFVGNQTSTPNVKSSQPLLLTSNGQPVAQKTNVHIVQSANISSVKQPGVNPGVITVRSQTPSQMTVVRPQIVSSQVMNASSPRPVRLQNRPGAAPIRIAASQPNIAPRPGGTGTLTLPPGIVPGPGAVLMKNEHGQLVIVHQPQLPPGSAAGATANAPQKHQGTPAAQRIQGSQILTIQPGATQSQTVIRPTVPAPVTAVKVHPGMRPPGTIQTGVRSTTPGITTTVGHPQAIPAQGQASATSTNSNAAHQQHMIEIVKKCKNFLSTLIKLASSQPEATVRSVRDLIQGLIDGKVEPELFTERLQQELKSSPQPCLVPFLKKSLPLLRQSLITNKMTIEGVKPPPLEVLHQFPIGIAPSGHVSFNTGSQPQGLPKTVINRIQHRPGVPNLIQGDPNRPTLTKQMNMMGGNVPNTVKAIQSRVADMHHSFSPGPSQSYKDNKKKFETLKDDDDINDVATMGGVNLSEESRNILATNADFIGTQIRSCKDESFLFHNPLLSRITAIDSAVFDEASAAIRNYGGHAQRAIKNVPNIVSLSHCLEQLYSFIFNSYLSKRYGLHEVPNDVVNLISHATQERLRHVVEQLSTIAEQRSELYKINDKFEQTTDVKAQLKFLEELDALEKKRHEEQEKEMLRRAAKSRSKHEDPEQLKLKQKAKEMHQAELEEVRQREANLTALAAIGPRKKRKIDPGDSSGGGSSGSGVSNTIGSSSSRSSLRPRVKRVNLRDVMFLMEQDRTLNKSNTLYRTFLK